jgi:hypothetical protein
MDFYGTLGCPASNTHIILFAIPIKSVHRKPILVYQCTHVASKKLKKDSPPFHSIKKIKVKGSMSERLSVVEALMPTYMEKNSH